MSLNMMHCASEEYHYDLNLSEIARIWRAGSILRARFLGKIMSAYRQKPDLMNLLVNEDFRRIILDSQQSLRFVLQNAIGLGIPALTMSVSLAYYDSYRSAVLPANLIQAQRDYFGAHTYHRVDKAGVFHTAWTAYE
jgi:6-phosphogluconate dehydrogenase